MVDARGMSGPSGRAVVWTAAVLLGHIAPVAADPAYFIEEIRPGGTSPWLSTPAFAPLDELLVTPANDGTNGVEPWVSDGTPEGTRLLANVKGSGDGVTLLLGRVGDRIYFLGDDGFLGREPWATDGTPAGTVPLGDLTSGSGDTSIGNVVRFRGKAFWIANGDLWTSDGSAAGTVRVFDAAGGSTATLIVYKGRLRWLNGSQFMSSDGTVPGTVAGESLPAGLTSTPALLTVVNDVMYFSGSDATAGTELWRTNWTMAGTTRVADIATGIASSFPFLSRLDDLVAVSAATPAAGRELWRSDGTGPGTQLVEDIRPGNSSSDMTDATAIDGVLYFAANDGVNGLELWRSDLTAAGTSLVRDIEPEPSPNSSLTRLLTRVGHRVVFVADDGAAGVEPWISDGTPDGTTLWEDIYPGTPGSSLRTFGPAGGRVFIEPNHPGSFKELWAKNAFDASATTLSWCDRPETGMLDAGTETFDMTLPVFAGAVGDLDLSFDISHPYVNDLTVTLTHVPSGVAVLAVNRPRVPGGGQCTGDNLDVRLDDEAATAFAMTCGIGTPAYARRSALRPDAALAAFDGRTMAGPWRLTVTDAATNDAATVHTWCLDFTKRADAIFLDGFE